MLVGKGVLLLLPGLAPIVHLAVHAVAGFSLAGSAFDTIVCGLVAAPHFLSAAGRLLAADATDARHMFAIGAHALPTFLTGSPGLIRCELVRRSFGVGGTTTFTGNLTLTFVSHGCKASGCGLRRCRFHDGVPSRRILFGVGGIQQFPLP
jgi:hypothetical protein